MALEKIKTDILIVRLLNDDDIISECYEDDNGLVLMNPVELIYMFDLKSGKKIINMQNWFSPSIIEGNNFPINYEDILTIANPSDIMLEKYFEYIMEHGKKEEEVKSLTKDQIKFTKNELKKMDSIEKKVTSDKEIEKLVKDMLDKIVVSDTTKKLQKSCRKKDAPLSKKQRKEIN